MKTTIVIVSLVLVAFLACGDSNDPSGPVGWNNGNWTGETAMETPLTFTLNHPTITNWTITLSYSYADTTDTRTWLCNSISIADDSTFSWVDSIDHDSLQYAFSFSGTFASGDSVNGLWDSSVTYDLPGHSGVADIGGSWTAVGPK